MKIFFNAFPDRFHIDKINLGMQFMQPILPGAGPENNRRFPFLGFGADIYNVDGSAECLSELLQKWNREACHYIPQITGHNDLPDGMECRISWNDDQGIKEMSNGF